MEWISVKEHGFPTEEGLYLGISKDNGYYLLDFTNNIKEYFDSDPNIERKCCCMFDDWRISVRDKEIAGFIWFDGYSNKYDCFNNFIKAWCKVEPYKYKGE